MTTPDQTADRTRDVAEDVRQMARLICDRHGIQNPHGLEETIASSAILAERTRLAEEIETLRRERDDAFTKNDALATTAQEYADSLEENSKRNWSREGGLEIAAGQWKDRATTAEAALAAAQAENARLREALEKAKQFIDEASGEALGIAMSGNDHPNWDTVLLDRSRAGMDLSPKLGTILSADKPAGGGEPVDVDRCAKSIADMVAEWYGSQGATAPLSHRTIARRLARFMLPAAPPAGGGEPVAWQTRGMNARSEWLPWQECSAKQADNWRQDASYRNGRREIRPLYAAPPAPAPAVPSWLIDALRRHPLGTSYAIQHDGFQGPVIGYYLTLEGKPGVVMQLSSARVVHVYGEKWLKPAEPAPAPDWEKAVEALMYDIWLQTDEPYTVYDERYKGRNEFHGVDMANALRAAAPHLGVREG